MNAPKVEKLVSIWKPWSWFSKWKYRLLAGWGYQTNIKGYSIMTGYVSLSNVGMLRFAVGYMWDGASGPTWDTKSCRRGALVHDGLYQLLRTGELPQRYKKEADQLLYDLCVEDGMWKIRAGVWKRAVEMFGSGSSKPKS